MTSLKSVLLSEDADLAKAYDMSRAKREIALMLRELRRKSGLTQIQLAQNSGLSQSHISKMESPTGGLPEIESCAKYVHGCGETLVMSPCAPGAFVDDATQSRAVI